MRRWRSALALDTSLKAAMTAGGGLSSTMFTDTTCTPRRMASTSSWIDTRDSSWMRALPLDSTSSTFMRATRLVSTLSAALRNATSRGSPSLKSATLNR